MPETEECSRIIKVYEKRGRERETGGRSAIFEMANDRFAQGKLFMKSIQHVRVHAVAPVHPDRRGLKRGVVLNEPAQLHVAPVHPDRRGLKLVPRLRLVKSSRVAPVHPDRRGLKHDPPPFPTRPAASCAGPPGPARIETLLALAPRLQDRVAPVHPDRRGLKPACHLDQPCVVELRRSTRTGED